MPKIILVETDKDVMITLSAFFNLSGYEIYKAFTSDECIEHLNKLSNIDVILINGNIASDRNAHLIVKIKKINSAIKIVVIADNDIEKTRIMDYGADEFSKKPISPNTIIEKVANTLIDNK